MHLPLKVLIVDDSAVIRRMLNEALLPEAARFVVTTAPNGRIALKKLQESVPALVILDLEMPEMDGIEFLGHLQADYPQVRVVVLTAHGALAESRAVHAMMMGAEDIFLKPVFDGESYPERVTLLRELLLPKLLQFVPVEHEAEPPPLAPAPGSWHPRAVVVGVSTGGPEALGRLIPMLPAKLPVPVLVVQHMPPGFTAALAERLDRQSQVRVREAADGMEVAPGTVLIAPGGQHMEVRPGPKGPVVRLTLDPPENSCRPAADVLFRSAAELYGRDLLVLIMTGMGADGTLGATAARRRGARVIAQDEASSVVWGMPGAAVQAGIVDATAPLDQLAGAIVQHLPGANACR